MNLKDLPSELQQPILLGCKMLSMDVNAYLDSLGALLSGVMGVLCGWKAIAAELGITNERSAYNLAHKDPLLKCIIRKRGKNVFAAKSDLHMYIKHREKPYKQ